MNARKTVRQPDGLRSEEPVRDDVWETACVVPPRKLARAPSLDIYVGEFSSSINAPRCADPELATNRGAGASDLPLVIVEEHGDLAGVGDTVRLVCPTVHHRTGLHSRGLAIDK